MKKPNKYYRAVFSFEVLSETPITQPLSLADIDYEVTEGCWSGQFLDTKLSTLTGKQMAKALRNQGSEPEFFGLDDAGRELSDD